MMVSKVLTPRAILFVPIAGGTSRLPGVVLFGMGLVGLIAIPAEIKKFKSKESGLRQFVSFIAADLILIIVGIVMLRREF
jgi:hypothetical protein